MASTEDIVRCLCAGDASEYRSDRHPDSSKVPFSENVTRHDLPCREDVCRWPVVRHDDPSALVHGDPEIGERDSRSQEGRRKREACREGVPSDSWAGSALPSGIHLMRRGRMFPAVPRR